MTTDKKEAIDWLRRDRGIIGGIVDSFDAALSSNADLRAMKTLLTSQELSLFESNTLSAEIQEKRILPTDIDGESPGNPLSIRDLMALHTSILPAILNFRDQPAFPEDPENSDTIGDVLRRYRSR